MSNWTVSKKLIGGFALLITIFMAAGIMNFLQIRAIERSSMRIVNECLPGLSAMGQVNGQFRQHYALMLRHLAANSPEEMDQIEQGIKDAQQKLDAAYSIYDKGIITIKDRQLVDNFMTARKTYRSNRDALVMPLSRQLKKAEATEVRKAKLDPYFADYAAATEAMMQYNLVEGEQAGSEIRTAVQQGIFGLITSSVLVTLIGAGVGFVIIRSTSKSLRKVTGVLDASSTQVASASAQISSSSQLLAEGASEQAASLEETSASLEEMASMTRRNAENAQSAKELATQARQAADAGASDMARMDGAMTEIKQASDNIAKIIKTIDEIAFQTNILALNAAVEAARAGEAGMGFAVVADEVRNLAQRSAQAAKETAEKIEDCIRKSEAGVEISSKVAGSLQEILAKAMQVDELVAEIATASREQSQGIDQVNTALTQMDKVTQTNAASAEESASAAEELNAQAQALKNAVGALQQLVGGGEEKGHESATAPSMTSAQPYGKAPVASSSSEPVMHTSAKRPKSNGIQGANGSRAFHGSYGNGRKSPLNAAPASAHNRNTIPLEDEFQDF